MRLLTTCTGCGRQYDVTGLAIDATLPCVCGGSVRVAAVEARDAVVVRCSACGATRQEGRASCGFCGSDFTLLEQDLHTICPACTTRISDRARFCHACGVAVAPQPAASAGRPRPCPTCPGQGLQHRALPGGTVLLECTACLGFWIGPQALRALLERADARSDASRVVLAVGARPAARPRQGPDPGRVVYLACPECGTRMNRRRFPGGAPVIVDFCREHGLWFEAQELERVLQAAAQGLGERRSVVQLPGDEVQERAERRRDLNDAWRAAGPLPLGREPSLLEDLLGLLGRLFL